MRIIWLGFAVLPLSFGIVLFFRLKSPPGMLRPVDDSVFPTFVLSAVCMAALSFWWRAHENALVGERPSDFELAALNRTASVAWLLCEGVAMLGAVLSKLLWDLDIYLPFLVASAVLFYFHRPEAWSAYRAGRSTAGTDP